MILRSRWVQRLAGALALVVLLGAFGFAGWTSDKCHREQNCGGYQKPEHKAASGRVPESADERIADYTWWLAAFTASLVAVSLFQGWFLIRADTTARTAADAALATATAIAAQNTHIKESIAEARRAATAAENQTNIIGLQTDILEKQKDIQRIQFFAEYRPRLSVRDVFFPQADFENLMFELTNTGGSPATVTGGFVAVDFVSDPLQFKIPSGFALGPILGTEIKDGQLCPFTIEVPPNVRLHLRFPGLARIRIADNPQPPLGDLYFFGVLSYTDGRGAEFGANRITVFRRRWDGDERAFYRTIGPDKEYAD